MTEPVEKNEEIAVELVKKDEKITIKSYGAEFYAHRPSWADSTMVNNVMREAREKKAAAEKKAAETGEPIEVDPLYFEKSMLKAYLIGWNKKVGVKEKVKGKVKHKPIPFSPDRVDELPYQVAWDISIQLGIIRLVSKQKNLQSSAGSKPISRKGLTGRATPAPSAHRTKSKTE